MRYRILRLLGKIAGENSFALKTIELTKEDGKGLAWDSEDRILFTLPFQDAKPVISLDSILPRVIELAKNSVDRKTKVAACELFHSIIIYTLASSSTHQSRGEKVFFFFFFLFFFSSFNFCIL